MAKVLLTGSSGFLAKKFISQYKNKLKIKKLPKATINNKLNKFYLNTLNIFNFINEFKPKVVGTDEAFALSAKILDIQDQISYPLDFPRVVHLKPMIQNWPWPADNVSAHVGFYLNTKGKLKIGNYQQHDIVHYVEKNKINLELINILEEIAWKK